MFSKHVIFRNKKEIILITLFMLLAQTISQGIPTIIKVLSDSIGYFDTRMILVVSVILILAGFIKYFSTLYADKLYWTFTNTIGSQMICEFLSHMFKTTKNIHSGMNTDDLLRIATSDLDQLKQSIVKQYFVLISTIVSIFTLFVFIFFLDYKLATITLIWYFAFYFVSKKVVDNVSSHRKHERKEYTGIVTCTKDAIYGLFDFKYFANINNLYKSIKEITNSYNKANVDVMITRSMSQYLSFIGNFVNIVIILLYKNYISKDVSTGTLLAMYMYSTNYTSIFESVLFLRTLSKDNIAYQKPINDFINSAELDNKLRRTTISSIESISTSNLSVSYEDDKFVFKDLNINFSKGNIYLIEGESGSGKTSLINALTLEIPYKGTAYYNNVDLSEIDTFALHSLVAVISQNTYLINGTIEENIKLFHDEYQECKITETATFLGLKNINSAIGTSELDKVSGGERKRIALARLFMSIEVKDVIILDETFANLDYSLSSLIIEKLVLLCKDKILVVVTHDYAIKELFITKHAKEISLS